VLVVPQYPYCIAMLLTWETVGQHGHSSSSAATCAQRVEESQRMGGTKRAQTISGMTWFSSAPLRSLLVKLYEPSPTPCLYVAPAASMVGRIPLMPCFLDGNATPTIPHKYSKNKSSCFPAGCALHCADAAAEDGRRGSNVYEVNTWLWMFGVLWTWQASLGRPDNRGNFG
jgi:hypothetical protein